MSPESLAAAYDFLRSLRPFSKWNLPDSSKITFGPSRATTYHGCCRTNGKKHRIYIVPHKKLQGVFETMAHEMIHVKLGEDGHQGDENHDAAFKKLAAEVCRALKFNPRTF